MKYLIVLLTPLLTGAVTLHAQSVTDRVPSRAVPSDTAARKSQAKALPTQPFGSEAFGTSKSTTLR